MIRMIVCGLVLLCWPSVVHAESIRLKDGTRLEGTIGAWNADGTEFYFDPAGENGEPRWVAMSEVEAIRYEGLSAKGPGRTGSSMESLPSTDSHGTLAWSSEDESVSQERAIGFSVRTKR